MDEKEMRKWAGLPPRETVLTEAKATQSELLTHVVRVMKKLKFNIISAGQMEGGVVVVRTRASDFALDAKMSAILGKDKFFVAVTLSSKEAIFRFESDLNENAKLNEIRAPSGASETMKSRFGDQRPNKEKIKYFEKAIQDFWGLKTKVIKEREDKRAARYRVLVLSPKNIELGFTTLETGGSFGDSLFGATQGMFLTDGGAKGIARIRSNYRNEFKGSGA